MLLTYGIRSVGIVQVGWHRSEGPCIGKLFFQKFICEKYFFLKKDYFVKIPPPARATKLKNADRPWAVCHAALLQSQNGPSARSLWGTRMQSRQSPVCLLTDFFKYWNIQIKLLKQLKCTIGTMTIQY